MSSLFDDTTLLDSAPSFCNGVGVQGVFKACETKRSMASSFFIRVGHPFERFLLAHTIIVCGCVSFGAKIYGFLFAQVLHYQRRRATRIR